DGAAAGLRRVVPGSCRGANEPRPCRRVSWRTPCHPRGGPPRTSRRGTQAARVGIRGARGMTGAGRFDWFRLTLRLHRFELVAFGAALIVLVVASFLVAAYIEGFTVPPECVFDGSGAEPVGELVFRCEELNRRYGDARSLG